MRILRPALLVLLLALIATGLVVWFAEPKVSTIEVDTAAVSGAEGARMIGHGLDIEPRDLAAAEELWDEEECTAARERLEGALSGGPGDGPVHVILSAICRRLGDADAALDHGLKGVELLPTVGRAHHVYARAITLQMASGGMLAAMRNLKPWREELRTAIELDPENLGARGEEFFFYAYVPSAMGGDTERALELAAALEAIDPARGIGLRARALERTERREEGVALCEAALEDYPGDATLLFTLGNLHEAAEDWSAADAAYARAGEEPQDVDGWRMLYQRVRLRTTEGRLEGQAEQALELLDTYAAGAPRAEMMPGPADLLRRRGQVLEALGRVGDARAAYEAALEVDPQHEAAQKALDALGPAGG